MRNRRKAAALGAAMLLASTLLTACMKDAAIAPTEAGDGDVLGFVTTDKSRYEAGESVKYSLEMSGGEGEGTLVVRYKQLDELVEEQEIEWDGSSKVNWEWQAPEADFTGYMTEIYLKQDSEIVDHTNIAVDVSSDWSKFPRYGYLADYMTMDPAEQETVIERLNRFRINGIQFYDWQWKHHIPLKLEDGQPATKWLEIANREVSYETVKRYIDLAHDKNMMAMNYNLLFGAYEDAEQDGVKREWGAFRDPLATDYDKHPLPDSWASDIVLMNPANKEWQEYIFEQEKIAFEHLPFDGWHVDQLGDRGSLWDVNGDKIDLAKSYVDFLNSAKEAVPGDYVMNAVGQYAQAYLATQTPVEFLYTEVWSGHPNYKSLKEIIDQNWKYSKGKLNTVLAAYMNYDHANSVGEFNTPAVLLTNAVIFASGGSHLELGENMLAKEYFPNRNLSIPTELEEQLVSYYDFLTAYQNVLRDGVQEAELEVTAEGVELSTVAEKGKVWAMAKEKGQQHVLHLVNFKDAVHMNWNDSDATQTVPELVEEVKLSVAVDRKVEKLWTASPDAYYGSAVELEFTQKDGQLSFTLPTLKYWDMVVIEYAD